MLLSRLGGFFLAADDYYFFVVIILLGLAKIAHGLARVRKYLGELAGAEDNEDDDEDDNQLHGSEFERHLFSSYLILLSIRFEIAMKRLYRLNKKQPRCCLALRVHSLAEANDNSHIFAHDT